MPSTHTRPRPTRRALATIALTLATAPGIGVVLAPSPASAAPAVETTATSSVSLQPGLPDNCMWTAWYDPWSWNNGWAGTCFENGELIWFDWNGGYGTVTSGGWF